MHLESDHEGVRTCGFKSSAGGLDDAIRFDPPLLGRNNLTWLGLAEFCYFDPDEMAMMLDDDIGTFTIPFVDRPTHQPTKREKGLDCGSFSLFVHSTHRLRSRLTRSGLTSRRQAVTVPRCRSAAAVPLATPAAIRPGPTGREALAR